MQQPRFANLRKIARTAIRIDAAASEVVGVGVVSTAAFILYVLIFIPVGLAALVATMLVVFAVAVLFPPDLMGYIVVGGLGLSLAVVFVVFVKLYRRLPRQVRDLAADPASLIPDDSEEGSGSAPAASAAGAPALSLAELDARLAPGASAGPSDMPGSRA